MCQKYSEFKSEDYTLKRNNKLLDLNQQFRFSGLPNNCTIEMSEAKNKRVEQDVVVCLQLDDGTRLNGSYKSSKTLHEIITELCPEKSHDNPVVIYMRSEVFGDALKTESLKTLGVSGGRVLLRLINSDPESLKTQANISGPLPQKPKLEESVESKSSKTLDQGQGPSGAFQLKSVNQLKEKKEEKMEIEEIPVDPIEEEAQVEVKSTQEEVKEPDPIIEQQPEIPPVINILDNRGTIIFSLDSIQTTSIDLPDSFFELTEADVRLLYRELRQQVDENENAPLMTSELRKLEENKKILNQLATYKNCAIRIQLPNRYVIQTKFSTVDTIGAVMDFVKEFLAKPDMKFYLFLTPPKVILDKDLTLVESKCVPSALLHFGTEESFSDILKPEIYEKLSSGSGASRVLLSANKFEEEMFGEASTSESSKPAVPKNFMESKVSSKPSGTIPKWFKPS